MNATTSTSLTYREPPSTSATSGESTRTVGRHLAYHLCQGFKYHDAGDRAKAEDAFFAVDRGQFLHLNDQEARRSAEAFVDALWTKDEVEDPYTNDGEIVDREGVGAADWSAVRFPLVERAAVVGLPEEYATLTTAAWKAHKTGGDYWTPTLRAQKLEVRVATGTRDRPRKSSDGLGGPGPLAARYLVAVELHDMHSKRHWDRAVDVLTGYFAEILQCQEGPA